MIQTPALMESNLSLLSSLKEEFKPEDYIQPHYRESYRLAIDSLVSGGKHVYEEFVKAEKIVSFLSEDEIHFITQNAEQILVSVQLEEVNQQADEEASTGTYWPTHSDAPPPDLELGWPEVIHNKLQTNIDLLYHPPRLNSPTIKEVVRKHIQEARQVIAIAMDIFTDVDIFKEVVDASVKGVPVYILLDHIHFKSFLNMAENHDIQIQKLRNMRVRTVKGQEYLCRSGAKFHGAMGQKFLLVDCQTVFFGSYSFMWSYEKIHLSMVQVITGRLVESYDEEFRTLYARSTTPAEFQPQEILPDRRINGKVEGYLGHPTRIFERRDHLRHTLDSVYRQTCERQPGIKSTLEDLPVPTALIPSNRLLQETTEYNKRHSYAGERREPSYIPQYPRYGLSNWNVAEENRCYGGNHYPSTVENPYESSRLNMINRSANLRQSYHGHDKLALSMQQNLPSLANTSKSFLRSWRIESYLKNSELPPGEPCDYLDQYEMENKNGPAVHSRLRSSLVFKSTIPEHPETNSYTNESLSSLCHDEQFGMRPGPQYYSSAQWNQTGLIDNHMQPDDFMLKRRSIQILDHSGNYTSGRDTIYASLGRAKSRFLPKDPDQENLYKRHSMADTRYNSYSSNIKESPIHMYGSLLRRQTERSTVGEKSKGGGYSQTLKEDHRSVSHHDFKKADSKDPQCTIWQEPPSRTVSATALEMDKEQSKSSGMSSPRFFKNSTKKIKSLLNIPERREGSPKRKNISGTKVGCSSDTILSDDGEHKAQHGEKHRDCTNISMKSTDSTRLKRANGRVSGNENHAVVLTGESSAPRFSTEDIHGSSVGDGTVRTSGQLCGKTLNERSGFTRGMTHQWQREQVGANRLYSRFEPLCTYETKRTSSGHDTTVSMNRHSSEKQKSSYLTKGIPGTEQSNHIAQHTHGHDNKFGRFIQRVGNLINKNK